MVRFICTYTYNPHHSFVYTLYNIIADINSVCKVNVHYEPPEVGLVRVETYVGAEEYKVKIWCIWLVCNL
jgi:hypothetical protein